VWVSQCVSRSVCASQSVCLCVRVCLLVCISLCQCGIIKQNLERGFDRERKYSRYGTLAHCLIMRQQQWFAYNYIRLPELIMVKIRLTLILMYLYYNLD